MLSKASYSGLNTLFLIANKTHLTGATSRFDAFFVLHTGAVLLPTCRRSAGLAAVKARKLAVGEAPQNTVGADQPYTPALDV